MYDKRSIQFVYCVIPPPAHTLLNVRYVIVLQEEKEEKEEEKMETEEDEEKKKKEVLSWKYIRICSNTQSCGFHKSAEIESLKIQLKRQ